MSAEPNWKEIAMQLAQRVNFAVQYLKGTGAMIDMETGEAKGWREYMAEGMELIPGVKVDREILATMHLPPTKRRKAQAEIRARREAEATKEQP